MQTIRFVGLDLHAETVAVAVPESGEVRSLGPDQDGPARSVPKLPHQLRGVPRISAATIVAEVGMLSRFRRPKQLMGYTGAVSREHASRERIRRGAIAKTGNSHLRRILVEAAWAYRHRPNVGAELRRRQANASDEVKEIAWKAQHRLHYRYARLVGRGKLKQQVVTGVARELAGFVWAIGVEVEKQLASHPAHSA